MEDIKENVYILFSSIVIPTPHFHFFTIYIHINSLRALIIYEILCEKLSHPLSKILNASLYQLLYGENQDSYLHTKYQLSSDIES